MRTVFHTPSVFVQLGYVHCILIDVWLTALSARLCLGRWEGRLFVRVFPGCCGALARTWPRPYFVSVFSAFELVLGLTVSARSCLGRSEGRLPVRVFPVFMRCVRPDCSSTKNRVCVCVCVWLVQLSMSWLLFSKISVCV